MWRILNLNLNPTECVTFSEIIGYLKSDHFGLGLFAAQCLGFGVVMLRFGFIDFDSIFPSTIRSQFDSVSNFLRSAHLCWPNSIRVWPRGNGSAAVLATHEVIPPLLPLSSAWTGKMLSGQSTDQTVWRCDTELKLPSWTARRYTLTLSIVWCSV